MIVRILWVQAEADLGLQTYIHEGHAEDGIDYIYNTPNHHEHGNWDIQQHHETYQPLWPQEPSETAPVPLPYPDPSEASERFSSLPVSLFSPPKKDDTKPATLSMNMERPDVSWNLCLAPAKYGGAEPEEELEMREGTGLRRGAASPDREFGREIGIGGVPPTCLDSEDEWPLLANVSAFWQEGQVALWRLTRMAWAGIQCSIMKWLKLEATCSKVTNQALIPSIVEETLSSWEDTKAWSPQISLTWFLTNSISGVDPTSRVRWEWFNSA